MKAMALDRHMTLHIREEELNQIMNNSVESGYAFEREDEGRTRRGTAFVEDQDELNVDGKVKKPILGGVAVGNKRGQREDIIGHDGVLYRAVYSVKPN